MIGVFLASTSKINNGPAFQPEAWQPAAGFSQISFYGRTDTGQAGFPDSPEPEGHFVSWVGKFEFWIQTDPSPQALGKSTPQNRKIRLFGYLFHHAANPM